MKTYDENKNPFWTYFVIFLLLGLGFFSIQNLKDVELDPDHTWKTQALDKIEMQNKELLNLQEMLKIQRKTEGKTTEDLTIDNNRISDPPISKFALVVSFFWTMLVFIAYKFELNKIPKKKRKKMMSGNKPTAVYILFVIFKCSAFISLFMLTLFILPQM